MAAKKKSEASDNFEENDELERQHYIQVLKTYKSYRSCSLHTLAQSEQQYNRLSNRQKNLIPDHLSYLKAIKERIEANHTFFEMVTRESENIFENKKDLYTDVLSKTNEGKSRGLDVDKIYSTLKQVVREWGQDGREERDLSYGVVVKHIIDLFAHHQPEDVSILVPGAGLGRLAYDLAQLGFCCEGNEYSLFMLVMSNFIINKCLSKDNYCIYPWIHDSTNCLSHSDQLRHSTFPDTAPSSIYAHHIPSTLNNCNSSLRTPLSLRHSSNLSENNHSYTSKKDFHEDCDIKHSKNDFSHSNGTFQNTQQSSPSLLPTSPSFSNPTSPSSPHPTSPLSPHPVSPSSPHPSSPSYLHSPSPSESSFNNFSIVAGDFLQVYKKPASWDCLATVFFLDTGHNILSYIDNIYNILKPGGYWLNFGPLLYHFANTDDSLELSYDQVKIAIQKIGFRFIKEEKNIPCTYNHNPPSMLTQQYHCVFFVVQKPC